jgi:superfamily II DNA/RNA helicase
LTDGRGKLLIFTEHRDTLKHLRHHLEKWGYTVTEIHGGMNPHERKRAQEDFRTARQICVATEAAGEGINLQFCRLMINYDLPWNPRAWNSGLAASIASGRSATATPSISSRRNPRKARTLLRAANPHPTTGKARTNARSFGRPRVSMSSAKCFRSMMSILPEMLARSGTRPAPLGGIPRQD